MWMELLEAYKKLRVMYHHDPPREIKRLLDIVEEVLRYQGILK